MGKLILIFLLGVFVGVVFAISGLRFFTPTVFVEGVVEYVLPNNTGAIAVLNHL